jgi:hypothetical protein
MKTIFLLAGSLVSFALNAAAARGGLIPINLSALANEPWTYVGPNDFLIINGDTFPTGSQVFGGIPFVISSSTNNYWAGAAAADFGPGTVHLTIPVAVSGVTSVFTVLNSMWGWAGPQAYLYVTFTGSDGATITMPLVGDVNVRDYNQDGNTNDINNTSTVQVWDNGLGQRLDRQEYILPPALTNQTLRSITITDTGDEGNGTDGSRAVLAAVTVSTCQAYVAETITVSRGPIVYDSHLKLYGQTVFLTNTGTTAIKGPIFYILQDLPAGVSVVNQSGGFTECFEPVGSRYVVALSEGTSLAPNTSVTFQLAFSDPSAVGIVYSPLTTGSLGGTP